MAGCTRSPDAAVRKNRRVSGPPPHARLPRARLVRARLAILAFFAVLGVTNGDWLARIPALKQGLHLSDGLLGLALLAAPAGSSAVAWLAGALVDRVGSRAPTMLAGLGVALLPISFGLAPNQAALMAGMFAFGVVAGTLDVSMNAQAVQLQNEVGRQLMTSFHACYSFGALAGGLIGGAFAWGGVGPAADLTAVALPMAALALAAGRYLLAPGAPGLERTAEAETLPGQGPETAAEGLVPVANRPGESRLGSALGATGGAATEAARVAATEAASRAAVHPARGARAASSGRGPRLSPLLVLSLLAVCSLLGEGAADGWSAVYMRDNLGTSAGFAALGYAAFALTMAFGRLAGDRLADRFGAARLLRGGGLLAAAGMALVLVTRTPAGALAGFAVYGAGLSCTFPQMLAVAGNIRPDRPGAAIARVAGTGYVGMLAGPVLIGGLATAVGLTAALGLPGLLALSIAAGARRAVPRAAGSRERR